MCKGSQESPLDSRRQKGEPKPVPYGNPTQTLDATIQKIQSSGICAPLTRRPVQRAPGNCSGAKAAGSLSRPALCLLLRLRVLALGDRNRMKLTGELGGRRQRKLRDGERSSLGTFGVMGWTRWGKDESKTFIADYDRNEWLVRPRGRREELLWRSETLGVERWGRIYDDGDEA
jgi:hypothetical protein